MTDDPYTRHLDDFGNALATAAPPRRGWVRPVLGGAAVVAAAVLVLLAISGGEGGRRLDAVAEARSVLAPDGGIVHMVIRAGSIDRPVLSATRPVEQWSADDPSRWRVVQYVDRSGGATLADAKGTISGRIEMAYADGRQSTYIAARNEVTVIRGFRSDRRGGESIVPGLLGGDPAARVRALLAAGRARDLGRVVTGGRTVRRLVSRRGSTRLVYDVDPATFAPVNVSITYYTGGEARRPIVLRFAVLKYERLPATPANLRLLRVRTRPTTRVIIRDLADVQRQLARRSPCRRPGGKVVCRGR